MRALLTLVLVLLAGIARAEGVQAYRAVGVIDIYDGSRSCTGTLISDRLVLTAAHCLYSPVTQRLVKLKGLTFSAGQRPDGAFATRKVVRLATAAGFTYGPAADLAGVADDIALIELDAPVKTAPASVVAMDGAPLQIVAYSHDSPKQVRVEGPCAGVGAAGGAMVVNCPIAAGASGGPVFVAGSNPPRLVAVVSASARDSAGRAVALTVPAAPQLAALKAALAGQRKP